MKKLMALLLVLLLTPLACAPVAETAALETAPAPSVDPNAPLPLPQADAQGWLPVRLTDEGHYLIFPEGTEFLEGDEESAAAGFYWMTESDLLSVSYRHDADDGVTLELYAQMLCAQEGFTAESLRIQNVDCVRLTPLDTDEGFFAVLWRAHAGEFQQLQFSFPLDTDDGYALAEQVLYTLGRYQEP